MIYLALLLLPLNLFAANFFELTDEELNPESEEILIKKHEKHLRNESMIYNLNTDLGIKDQRRYTGTDENRFSGAFHVSGDYEHINDILGVELSYMRRSTRYNQFWYGAQLFRHNTYFDAITQNSTSNSTNVNAESRSVRPGGTKNTVTATGIGMSYRFKLLLDFYPTEDVFESVEVFANAISLNESFISRTYKGYGLTTSYGIHKRSSTAFFYGGKFSYNVASVTREAIVNESKSDRSLSLGWLSLGFEMGFFY